MPEELKKAWEIKGLKEIIRDSANGIAASAWLLMKDYGFSYDEVKELADTAYRGAMLMWCPDPNAEPRPIEVRVYKEMK